MIHVPCKDLVFVPHYSSMARLIFGHNLCEHLQIFLVYCRHLHFIHRLIGKQIHFKNFFIKSTTVDSLIHTGIYLSRQLAIYSYVLPFNVRIKGTKRFLLGWFVCFYFWGYFSPKIYNTYPVHACIVPLTSTYFYFAQKREL